MAGMPGENLGKDNNKHRRVVKCFRRHALG
jgi:hypothetical protein